jgi:hypothetical protein
MVLNKGFKRVDQEKNRTEFKILTEAICPLAVFFMANYDPPTHLPAWTPRWS